MLNGSLIVKVEDRCAATHCQSSKPQALTIGLEVGQLFMYDDYIR